MNIHLEVIAKIWPGIQHVLSLPHDEEEYNRLVELLDSLIDEVGEDESHPLASLMETVGSLIESYETSAYPESEADPMTTLKTLMDDHGLTQSDLNEIGSQGVVSEILSGKRQLNVRQIKLLGERFNVSPLVFM